MVTTRQNPSTGNTDVLMPGATLENPQWAATVVVLPQTQGTPVSLISSDLLLLTQIDQAIAQIKAQVDALALNASSLDTNFSDPATGTNFQLSSILTQLTGLTQQLSTSQSDIHSEIGTYQATLTSLEAKLNDLVASVELIQAKQATWDTNSGPASETTMRVAIATGNETPRTYLTRAAEITNTTAAVVASQNVNRTFLMIENATGSTVFFGMDGHVPSSTVRSFSLQPSQPILMLGEEAAVEVQAIGAINGSIMITEGVR